MVFANDGTLTTDKRTIDDAQTWDSQTDWEAYQSRTNIEIINGIVKLLEIPSSVEHLYPADEGTGTVLTDNIGSLDGTISGGTWTTLAKAVGGVYLDNDGVDDEITFGTDAFNFVVGSDYTFTGWILPRSDGSVVSWRAGGGGFSIRISGGDFQVVHSNVANDVVTGPAITLGEWQYITVRFDSSASEVTMEVDDAQVTGTLDPAVSTSGIQSYFGNGLQGYFNAGYDECTLSAVYLSDTDIQTLQDRRSK